MEGKVTERAKYELLPPLTTEEFEALRASIELEGVREPVVLDEEGNVLDGHHRLKIKPDAPTRTIAGLTEAEKQAYVYQANLVRRNLSPDQKKAARKRMQTIAKTLRNEDRVKNTNARVGALLGVSEATVSRWLTPQESTNNLHMQETCTPPPSPPDARVKISPTQRPMIVERLDTGESQEQVAADYGVTQQAISMIATKERKQKEAAVKREATVAKIGDCGIRHGDMRVLGSEIEDNSVDLIFTDPPYLGETLSLYGDLAKLAARVLRPGGWCLAYAGHTFLPQIYLLLGEHLEYGWTFAIQHSGGDARFRKLKIDVKWKPILGFYKPPLNAWWNWFPDLVSGGREKTLHEWQQAEQEAAHYIQALSPKHGVILDPFVGSGTSCVAAKKLGRQWIGFELDQEYVKKARVRIHDCA